MMQLDRCKLWTAMVTPLNENLSIDFVSLKNLIFRQAKSNNGLLFLGSTGEGLNIHIKERKKIVEYVFSFKLDVPVMVGVDGFNLTETMAWLNFLRQFPIDAYLMVTPIYAKPGSQGQYQWFKRLMDVANKPVMIYNVPKRTGVPLSLEAISMLKSHKNYWTIKESSGSTEKFKAYLNASEPHPVYCGDDGLMSEFSTLGACGLVSVASNVWPRETHLYAEKCLNKTFQAKELWKKVASSLFITSSPIPAKAILHKQNHITHNTMMPPLSAQDLQDISPLEMADQAVQKWYLETHKE